jgi:hypothetical protein
MKSVGEVLGIPNLVFGKVLMLMVGFTLEVFDTIKAKNIKNRFTAFGLGVVREEAVGCTMVEDQIFESLGHVEFKTHGVDVSLGVALANIALSHSRPSMTDTEEEGVSCKTFFPAMDVVSRETGLAVLLHR